MAEYLDKAWLTPWEAVQLIVARDHEFGPQVADLASEKDVIEYGIPAVLVRLHQHLRLERFSFAFEGEKRKHGNRAVGAFQRAIERLGQEWEAGRIEGTHIPQDLTAVHVKALSTCRIDFERGSLVGWPPGAQIRLKRDAITRLCAVAPNLLNCSDTAPIAKTKPKRGSTYGVDWDMVAKEIFRLMDHHQDFAPHDLEWNAQARLEEKVQDYIEQKFKRSPSESTVRTHVSKSLADWKAGKGLD